MATMLKNSIAKWIITATIVLSMYSLSYFYYLIPGSDSHYFRGLTEYFVETGTLDISNPYHSYYQWPLFFVLSKMAYTLGLALRSFEFILFGFLGFIYTTSLYSIFHKFSKGGAYLAVISFFIILRYYFNYQFVPFSLAIGLLFILFMLDTRENKTRATILTTLIIFTSMTLTHSFVPVFFIFYTVIKYFISKDRAYLRLFQITLIIYFIVLMVQAVIFFPMVVEQLLGLHSTVYTRFAETFLIEATTPLDELAQMISRTILIATALVAGSGFIILLLKRKVRHTNFALFLTGAIYAIASALLPILGVRAFAIIGIPLSLGVTYFLKTRFKKYFLCLFLITITLFTFVPLHSSYSSTRSEIQFQTKENYQCTNFLIRYYAPNVRRVMLADFRTRWYLVTKGDMGVRIESGFSDFHADVDDFDSILFTIALEKKLLQYNCTIEDILRETNERNIIYNSGSSYFLVNKAP